MIDRFTRDQFEASLPKDKTTGSPLWERAGFIDGEFVYAINVTGTNKRIMIRSSIDGSKMAATSGKDSIRLWVEYFYRDRWNPLAKYDAWTTRVPGWDERMTRKLRELWAIALKDSKNHLAPSGQGQAVEVPTCPNCGAPMILRSRRLDGNKFWGCSKFPNCRGTRNWEPQKSASPDPAQKKDGFSPSGYQSDIRNEWLKGEQNLVVIARPGSGKTSTLEWLIKLMPVSELRVALIAFNKKIAAELSSRIKPINPSAHVSTFHSLGYSNIRAVWGSVKVEPFKVRNLIRSEAPRLAKNFDEQAAIEINETVIARLVSLLKATLSEPTPENMQTLVMKYSLEIDGSRETVFRTAAAILEKSIANHVQIDYDDMIYHTAVGNVPAAKFDRLMIDEAQDLNFSQIQFVLNSVADGGLALTVGDPHQSIYGFRGADSRAIKKLADALSAKIMPLSISYRLPKSHVTLVNQIFPHGQIEAAPNAKEGTVEAISDKELVSALSDGDMVLCRCNAPLVPFVWQCIRAGKKAIILGRDVGKGLVSFIDRIQKRARAETLDEFLEAMSTYVQKEIVKLVQNDLEMQAEALEDKASTIFALSDGASTIDDIKHNIRSVFSDKKEGIIFATVHGAKGTEADDVYILRPELMPHPKAKTEEEREQETFIAYVALTRSKNRLVWVR